MVECGEEERVDDVECSDEEQRDEGVEDGLFGTVDAAVVDERNCE